MWHLGNLKLTPNTETAVRWNLSPSELIRFTLKHNQGKLTSTGVLSVNTGRFTGRSPEDRYFVKDDFTSNHIDWQDEYNIPLERSSFESLLEKAKKYLFGKEIFAKDLFAVADPVLRKKVRIVTEYPWSCLFAHNMFRRPSVEDQIWFSPDWHIICLPGFEGLPEVDNIRSPNFSAIDFTQKIILIGGSGFTGEIKKSFFTALNLILPLEHEVLPMHCSAIANAKGATTLMFGLSGTGKTTLSSDDENLLIGDDEIGWSSTGIFNVEGGCYARVLGINEKSEPQIHHALRYGALLENIIFKADMRTPDFSDSSITHNARVSYPLDFVERRVVDSLGDHPKNIIFLTCDTFGVIPPVSLLNEAQAIYFFLNGYSAKIPGSEVGITQPKPDFVACFGAPFLPLDHLKYAQMLKMRLRTHMSKVWLVNTGWVGGAYGVGQRIDLKYSRIIVRTIVANKFKSVDFEKDSIFGFSIPKRCPGIPNELLRPGQSWSDKGEYHSTALNLKKLFFDNFSRYRPNVDQEILDSELKNES